MEYSPKCHPIYTRASLSGRNIIVAIYISIEFAVVLSSIEYLWKRDKPKVSNFGPTLNPLWLSLLKMVQIEKNKWQCGKTSAIELSKYVKKKSLIHLPFPGKIRLFFAIFRVTLPGNTLGSQVKGVESKFDKYTFDKYKYTYTFDKYTFDKYKYKYTFTQIQIHIHIWQIRIWQIQIQIHIWQIQICIHTVPGQLPVKKIGSNIFQFFSGGYISQRTFLKNFNPDFQIWLVFLVPFLHFL